MTGQEAAARYAEHVLQMQRRRTLSGFIAQECELSQGTFRWEFDPVIGTDGDWYDPGTVPPAETRGVAAVTRLLAPLLTDQSLVVLEDPIVLPSRPSAFRTLPDESPVRVVFKSFGLEVELFALVPPAGGEEAIRDASHLVVGAYYLVGIVTRRGLEDLPQHGHDVTDEQVREWARGTTHFIFRGPSYDGYVLWERNV